MSMVKRIPTRLVIAQAQGLVPRSAWESDAEGIHRTAVDVIRGGCAEQGQRVVGDISLEVFDPRDAFDASEMPDRFFDLLMITATAQVERASWWQRVKDRVHVWRLGGPHEWEPIED